MPVKVIDNPKVALESAQILKSACYFIKNQNDLSPLENYLKETDSFSFPSKYFGEDPALEATANKCLGNIKRDIEAKNYASACLECEKIGDVLNQAGSQIVRKILGLPRES
jgi:hypothetical protein